MIRRAAFLICLAAALPSAAQAQVFQGGQTLGATGASEIVMAGIAPQACLLQPPTQAAVANATLVAGANAAEVRLTQLVDPVTAVPNAATIEMSFPVICNGAHTVTVRTGQGALVLAAPAPAGPGINNRLPYQLTAIWGGQQVTAASDAANPVAITTPDGSAGVLSLSIQIPGGGPPLVAGPYADSLVVELQPAN